LPQKTNKIPELSVLFVIQPVEGDREPCRHLQVQEEGKENYMPKPTGKTTVAVFTQTLHGNADCASN